MTTLPPSRRALLALAGLALASPALASGERTTGRARAGTTPLTTANLIGKKLRVFEEGRPITMDYSEDRVNIEIDGEALIKRIFIG
jgi:hypothetical protein